MEEKEKQANFALFLNEIRDLANFKDKILTTYLAELEENIYLVLKLKEEFYDYLIEKINFVIADKYSNDVFTNASFAKVNEEIKTIFLDDYYNPIYSFLAEKVESAYFQVNKRRAVYRKNNGRVDSSNLYKCEEDNHKKTEFENFIKHCPKTDEIALHSCKKDLNFLQFSKDELEFEFFYCKFCNEVYFSSYVKLYCKPCQQIYISSNLKSEALFYCSPSNDKNRSASVTNANKENDKVESLNAYLTYQKYHSCNSYNWEPIKCLECNGKNKLIFNLNDKTIYCRGCPGLNFIDEKGQILDSLYDICSFCKEEFQGNIKIFNGLEKRDLEFAIKNALLLKENAALPNNTCISNTCTEIISKEKLNFIHDLKCKGAVFVGEYNFTKIIVCSICKFVTEFDKFVWFCPVCQNQNCKKIKEEKVEKQNFPKLNSIKSHDSEENVLEKDTENRKRNYTGFQKAIPDLDNLKHLALSDLKNLKSNLKNFNFGELSKTKNKEEKPGRKITFDQTQNSVSFGKNDEKISENDGLNEPALASNNNEDCLAAGLSHNKSTATTKDELDEDKVHSPFRLRNYTQYNKDELPKNEIDKLSKTPRVISSNIFERLNPKENQAGSSDKNANLIDNTKNRFNNVGGVSINTPKSSNKFNFFKENFPFNRKISQNINTSEENVSKIVNFNLKQMILDNPLNAKNFLKENNILSFVNGSQAENSPLTPRSNKIIINNNIININITENNSNMNIESASNSASLLNKMNLNSNYNLNSKNQSSNNLIKIQNPNLENDPNSIHTKNLINNPNLNYNNNNNLISEPNSNYKKTTCCINKPESNSTEKDEKESNPSDAVNIKKNSACRKFLPRMSEIRINVALGEFNYEDYKVISKIGEGSFGQIYHVEDNLKRSYCMKKIVSSDLKDLNAFAQEFELVNKIRHDNVLRIYSVCRRKLDSTTFVLYILMEKAITDWDREIKARAGQKKYYAEGDLLIILKQCVEALSFLQQNSISHRDIKPQNILLFKDGVFKMADFGEAKKIKNSQFNRELNTLRGTELYMSPILLESLNRNCSDVKHNSYKSDVFSLGFCFLYAASLNLNHLFDLRKIYDSNVMSNRIKKILRPLYSEFFIEIIQLMLEIREEKRYDFVDLKRLLEKNDI